MCIYYASWTGEEEDEKEGQTEALFFETLRPSSFPLKGCLVDDLDGTAGALAEEDSSVASGTRGIFRLGKQEKLLTNAQRERERERERDTVQT